MIQRNDSLVAICSCFYVLLKSERSIFQCQQMGCWSKKESSVMRIKVGVKWVLVALMVLSGCINSLDESFKNHNFVSKTQVCQEGHCTDDINAIKAAMNYAHRLRFGHDMVVPLTGSVLAANSHITCPQCGTGTFVDLKEWHLPFNPHDDDDERPHVAVIGACNNPNCQYYRSHREVPGSLKPSDEVLYDALKMCGNIIIPLPDSPLPAYMVYPTPSLAPGVRPSLPAENFSPAMPRFWLPSGFVPVPAP